MNVVFQLEINYNYYEIILETFIFIKMTHFIFEDHNKKLCSIYDLKLIQAIYCHWDLHSSPDEILEWTQMEIQNFTKNRIQFESSEHFRDKETKDFLINQSDQILRHLKRLEAFLKEGIEKGYHLYIE
jgi:hypothetical protein